MGFEFKSVSDIEDQAKTLAPTYKLLNYNRFIYALLK